MHITFLLFYNFFRHLLHLIVFFHFNALADGNPEAAGGENHSGCHGKSLRFKREGQFFIIVLKCNMFPCPPFQLLSSDVAIQL